MDRIQDIMNRLNENSTSTIPSWYDNKGKFLHYVLGRYMLDTCHIGRLNGVVHIYDKDKRSLCE